MDNDKGPVSKPSTRISLWIMSPAIILGLLFLAAVLWIKLTYVVPPSGKVPAEKATIDTPERQSANTAATASVPPVANGTQPDVTDVAQGICTAAERTGGIIECTVDISLLRMERSVDISVVASPSQAMDLCLNMASTVSVKTSAFSPDSRSGHPWKLRMFSPYDAGGPIAVCNLY